MTHEQKKAIYDSVMQKFSVIVKNKLDEALDYKAENGDGAADGRAEYFEDAVELLIKLLLFSIDLLILFSSSKCNKF